MRLYKSLPRLIVIPLLLFASGGAAMAQTNLVQYISAAEATNYMGVQVVVTDMVVQVAIRPTVVLLNLNKRYPDSPLTCVIRRSDTNQFPDVESYWGKRVEVSGRIIDYQGRPEIILTSINQITILEATSTSASPSLPTLESPATAVQPATPTTPGSPLDEQIGKTKALLLLLGRQQLDLGLVFVGQEQAHTGGQQAVQEGAAQDQALAGVEGSQQLEHIDLFFVHVPGSSG